MKAEDREALRLTLCEGVPGVECSHDLGDVYATCVADVEALEPVVDQITDAAVRAALEAVVAKSEASHNGVDRGACQSPRHRTLTSWPCEYVRHARAVSLAVEREMTSAIPTDPPAAQVGHCPG